MLLQVCNLDIRTFVSDYQINSLFTTDINRKCSYNCLTCTTFVFQCETMGLQPTPPPAPTSPSPLLALKRKLEAEKEEETLAKKVCVIMAPALVEREEVRAAREKEEEENDKENKSAVSPKVIVEHQPLPSIYELQQNSIQCEETTATESSPRSAETADEAAGEDDESFDSGLSDESSDPDEEEEDDDSDVADDEDEDDDEDDESSIPMASPLYNSVLRMDGGVSIKTPTPPKTIYGDRFWQQSTSNGFTSSTPTISSTSPSSSPSSTTSVSSNNNASTFQFLDESSNPRIECAENGKSYLQLGTMSHHHLPVTPIMQPKPNGGMIYRRPIPPFRQQQQQPNQQQMIPQAARPVCDHSNCLQKRNSVCYRATRARMLNLSLHKLHLARQNHEGCLRRSVLICNMLRHIEDETEREAVAEHQQQQAAAAAAAAAGGYVSPPHGMEGAMPQDIYWSSSAAAQNTTTLTDTSSQHQLQTVTTGGGHQQQQHQLQMSAAPQPPLSPHPSHASQGYLGSPNAPPASGASPYTDTYETALKDFNNAFRITPYSSPGHVTETDIASNGTPVADEADRGINWGSVLSLSNQSEMDPLNNNSFVSEPWITPSSSLATAMTSTTVSTTLMSSTATENEPLPAGATSPTSDGDGDDDGSSNGSDDSGTAGHSFVDADIGWKLSADDVLRVFPNDENIFASSAAAAEAAAAVTAS
jgi:hypothetical protein